MLAVPKEERGPLRGWSLAILGALEPAPPKSARLGRSVGDRIWRLSRRAYRALQESEAILAGGDVLGMLLAEETEEGERLSDVELIQNCIFLLNAGHETTTNLIGNAIAALIDHPAEWRACALIPSLIDSAVEEFLRFESSNQLGNRRVLAPVEIGGVTLEAGTLVTLGIGAANRDPAQFPNPDRLDVGRTPNRHLAFGGGIHACAGMSLARVEGRIAIGRLIERAPAFRKAGDATRGGRARFRGLLVLSDRVRLDRRRRTKRRMFDSARPLILQQSQDAIAPRAIPAASRMMAASPMWLARIRMRRAFAFALCSSSRPSCISMIAS